MKPWLFRGSACPAQAQAGWLASKNPNPPTLRTEHRSGPGVVFTAGENNLRAAIRAGFNRRARVVNVRLNLKTRRSAATEAKRFFRRTVVQIRRVDFAIAFQILNFASGARRFGIHDGRRDLVGDLVFGIPHGANEPTIF